MIEDGRSCLMGLVLVIIALGLVAWAVLSGVGAVGDMIADFKGAEAKRIQSLAELETSKAERFATEERVKQDREHQQSVDHLREMEFYALTMKMFSSDKSTEITIAAALIGALAATLLLVGAELFLRVKGES